MTNRSFIALRRHAWAWAFILFAGCVSSNKGQVKLDGGGKGGAGSDASSSRDQSSGGATVSPSTTGQAGASGGTSTSTTALTGGQSTAIGGTTASLDAGVDRAPAGGSGGTVGGAGAGGITATGGADGRGQTTGADGGTGTDWQKLRSDFVDWRFGMFIHFGILTYTGSWAQANLPIEQFSPTKLDCNQWATAAASAKMKFGVLTSRHHDGFALWPSKASTFNVGNISWRSGKGDVVKEYTDAFRAKGLDPGLYYSIWDATQGNAPSGNLSATQMQYIKTQLTELLSNYGKIPLLVLDGYAWKMGHRKAPYPEIHDLIKSLQPEILIVDHDCIQGPWDADLAMYEEPKGVFAPTGNTIAAGQDTKINNSGGNDWFWSPTIGDLMSVSTIVDGHLKKLEPAYTTFILNCPPNRDGLMDPAIVTLLGQVGSTWSPNTSRAPLPPQVPLNEHPYMPASATATSGTAFNAIDGVNDSNAYSVWTSSNSYPQSLTLDLGEVKPDVGYLGYLPGYSGTAPTNLGNITSYKILVSSDNSTFSEAISGTWANSGQYKAVTFGPVAGRYVRLQVDAASGSSGAQATEVVVGAKR